MLLLLRLLEGTPYNANVLGLDWEISEDRKEPVITFRAGLGNDSAATLGSATSTELGLPPSVDAVRQGFEASPAIPERLRQSLSRSFNDGFSQSLHIHFQRRDGYLAMIHWEALLRPIVGERRRIRRLPYYSLPSVAYAPNDLALLIDPALTEPSPKLHRILRDVTASFLMGNGNKLHLFASQSLISRVKGFNDVIRLVELHTFESGKEQSTPPPSSQDKPASVVEHPLLRWVAESLTPSPVNCVVFVCQGGIELNEGVITFRGDATLGTDAVATSKSIAADELATFLMHLGASGCAFVGPNSNVGSGTGLRLLADKLAQIRPGSTAAMEADDRHSLYEFLFDVGIWSPWFVFPSSVGYLSSEFPWLHLAGDQIILTLERFTLLRDLVSEYKRHENVPYGETTHSWRLPAEPVPRWLIAVQRHLEMWAARLLESSVDDSVRLGMEDSVTNLRDTVRRYLKTNGGAAKP